jgi:metal-sulfur cluster biosynthetic enzyme
MSGLNANPTLFEPVSREPQRSAEVLALESDPDARDPLDAFEVFDMVRGIKDPEHPHTLEQLRVTQQELIKVDDRRGEVSVHFTPTIPHCSMATLIGLCIRVKLIRSLPTRFKVDVNVTPGSHASEAAVNKQLNDKERVAAALENDNLLRTVNGCLAPDAVAH